MSSKLDALRLLLDDEQSWEQAVELIISMDDPDVWREVLTTMDEVVQGPELRLLGRLPRAHPRVEERRLSIRKVRLGRGTDLDASLTPNLESVTVVLGRRRVSWLPELKKLPELRRLWLQGVTIDEIQSLDLPGLQSLTLMRCRFPGLPVLPKLQSLELTSLGEDYGHELPIQPALQSLTIHRAGALHSDRDGWEQRSSGVRLAVHVAEDQPMGLARSGATRGMPPSTRERSRSVPSR